MDTIKELVPSNNCYLPLHQETHLHSDYILFFPFIKIETLPLLYQRTKPKTLLSCVFSWIFCARDILNISEYLNLSTPMPDLLSLFYPLFLSETTVPWLITSKFLSTAWSSPWSKTCILTRWVLAISTCLFVCN